jgi:hypothetical protein
MSGTGRPLVVTPQDWRAYYNQSCSRILRLDNAYQTDGLGTLSSITRVAPASERKGVLNTDSPEVNVRPRLD